jgi:hypothetical protein
VTNADGIWTKPFDLCTRLGGAVVVVVEFGATVVVAGVDAVVLVATRLTVTGVGLAVRDHAVTE